ncbi:MAG: hypothetical protein SNH73_02065 [Rikenellaceae bacterium]
MSTYGCHHPFSEVTSDFIAPAISPIRKKKNSSAGSTLPAGGI